MTMEQLIQRLDALHARMEAEPADLDAFNELGCIIAEARDEDDHTTPHGAHV